LIALTIFVGLPTYYTFAADAALSVNVLSSMTFSVSTDDWTDLTPGTPAYATSTLSMLTTNNTGYNVTLQCTGKTTDYCLTHTDTTTQIADDTDQWSIGAATATTTAGNASQLTSGEDIFAFRGMTATSSQPGTGRLFPTTWWGTVDAWPGVGTTLWAGVASTTNPSRIGNISWYNAATDLNTVQYYVDVLGTQKGGVYSATLVYTGTANP
jgi:hypothetical protein